MSKARRFLDARSGERVTLSELARAVGASPSHLQRRFKSELGLSPRDYQREHRLARAKQLLASGADVTSALFDAGYGSASRFYESATQRLGMRARDYRKRGHGLGIDYTIFASRLGQVLIAATPRGLCSVKLGDDPGALSRALREEFSRAELTKSPRTLAPYRRAIQAFLAGDRSLARVPLDLQGTVFQRRVWQALCGIPRGETRSYRQIADAIGAPAAMRAVGSACGANPVALAIPCHRALRADGQLGGYAWGLDRKRKLLEMEARAAERKVRGSPNADLERDHPAGAGMRARTPAPPSGKRGRKLR